MTQNHEILDESRRTRILRWDKELIVQMPDRWIDPSVVKDNLPPYYAGIVTKYQEWMDKPHRSLAHLSWNEGLFLLYAPQNPAVKDRETETPSTYFVFEALYLFSAGIITGETPPVKGLEKERAEFLKKKIAINTLELMSYVADLGRGAIAFDVEHNWRNKTWKLVTPKRVDHRGNKLRVNTFTSKGYSQLAIDFALETERLTIRHQELDTFRFTPPKTQGLNTSMVADVALDRSRSGLDERRLQIDLDISEVVWEYRSDGKYMPIARTTDFLNEYLGTNVHHIDLALQKGNETNKFRISQITHEVMVELGLVPLLDLSWKTRENSVEE